MSQYEALWQQIDANTERLHTMDQSSPEYRKLLDETADMIIASGDMTIGEAQEEVK